MARKRIAAIIATALSLFACFSCASDDAAKPHETTAAPTEETTIDELAKYADDLGEHNFDSEDFIIAVFLNINVNNNIDTEAETGDVLADAIYKRNRSLEERFNVTFKQSTHEDSEFGPYVRRSIQANDKAFHIANMRCTDGLNLWLEGMILPIEKVPYINLEKPYWDRSLNESLTVNKVQYIALGHFNVNVDDITHALLFSKTLMSDLGLSDIYETVRGGNWTFDAMNSMMVNAIADLNGDGEYDGSDRWGYLASPKEILPNFWISAGEFSVAKDENDMPTSGIETERFYDVFIRTFEMMWDDGAWYTKAQLDADIPTECINMFANHQSLFLDSTFFVIGKIRGMEADFGIIPYPKLDEAQKQYVSRVEYYFPTIVPINSDSLEITGIMLEALQSESAKTVRPAYYDIALKTKYTRDDESAQMLALIFSTRVVDMGDTTLCDKIRDGFMAQMFSANNRNLASSSKQMENIIKNLIKNITEKVPETQ